MKKLEFGEEDDVDAARAKLKEWVLESGYDENYEFNIEDTINDIEEFSNDGTDENGSVFVDLEHLDEKLNSMIGCSENRLSESYGKIRASVCKVCGKEGSKTNI